MKPVSTMGSGELGREVDLEQLVSAFEDSDLVVETNFHSPSMVTLRFTEDGPAVTIYRTGSYQIRGTPDRKTLLKSNEDFHEKLKQVGLNPPTLDFEQKNTVFLTDLEQALDLETLAIQLGLENIEYEPEQFPGLIYRPSTNNGVLLVFASGKIIISGVINRTSAEKLLSHLQDQIG